MRKLDRIRIKNFKSIKDLDFELKSLNILIGENGAGKSNFIDALDFLKNIINRNLQNYTAAHGGADNILYYGKKFSKEIEIELFFNKQENGYRIKLEPTVEDNFYFKHESTWYYHKKFNEPSIGDLGSGHIESDLPKINFEPIADYILKELKNIKAYHFHDTSDAAKVKQTGDIHDNHELHSDAGNLAAFLYMLRSKHYDHFSNIETTIRMIAPFFDTFYLEPLELNKQNILLRWKEKGSEKIFHVASLSDGTLRFICLSTLLLQPDLPSLIILDEPELGLHPTAIMILASLLTEASHRTQVLVATQSVTLVNQFAPKDIIVIERDQEQSSFKRLDIKHIQDWLDEYAVGDLWEKNVIGGRP